jgi:hypothetical protein
MADLEVEAARVQEFGRRMPGTVNGVMLEAGVSGHGAYLAVRD